MAGAPYHDREGFIWMDGAMQPWREAKLHVLSHGLHYASAVFEGERAYGGVIFKSREHSERLVNSAKLLGFEIPYSIDEIEAAKLEAMQAGGLEDAYVRAIAWRGSEMMGVSAQHNTIHLAVAAWEWGAYFGDAREKGARLTIADWKRPAPDTIPCKAKAAGLYMICTLSKHAAEAAGYEDALMMDYRGQVAECTGANIFFVKDGELHTPIPDCFLDGVTRRTAIDLAGRRQIKVHERVIMPNELESFEQCFLTGTAAEITPVSQIADARFEVGAIAKGLAKDYNDLVNGRLES